MIPCVTSSTEELSDNVTLQSNCSHDFSKLEGGNQITSHYDQTSFWFPWGKPIQTDVLCVNFKKGRGGEKKEIAHTFTGMFPLQQCFKATRFLCLLSVRRSVTCFLHWTSFKTSVLKFPRGGVPPSYVRHFSLQSSENQSCRDDKPQRQTVPTESPADNRTRDASCVRLIWFQAAHSLRIPVSLAAISFIFAVAAICCPVFSTLD